MQSSLIGKIEKAIRYAEEPERVTISDLTVKLEGDNSSHEVGYGAGKWHCTCHFFSQRGFCSHTMALQRLFASMLSEEALSSPASPLPG